MKQEHIDAAKARFNKAMRDDKAETSRRVSAFAKKRGKCMRETNIQLHCSREFNEMIENEANATEKRLGCRVSKSDLLRALIMEGLRARGHIGLHS